MTDVIFIKAEEHLIVNISPEKKLREIIDGLLYNLTQGKMTQPICLTKEGKERGLDFLNNVCVPISEKFKRLLHFFEEIKLGEHFYVYQYIDDMDYVNFSNYYNSFAEFYVMLQFSLVWYNSKLSEDEITAGMEKYLEHRNELQELMESWNYYLLPYDASLHSAKKKKLIVGQDPRRKRERVCIYCGCSEHEEGVTFKHDSHAIPESLGNKFFFQYEECDICNDKFSILERDLTNFFCMARLRSGIKGKDGYPVFKFRGDIRARYFNMSELSEEDFKKPWGKMEFAKDFLKDKPLFKGPILASPNDSYKASELNTNGKMTLELVEKYHPRHVYEALVRCVINMIPKGQLVHFQRTIEWLNSEPDLEPDKNKDKNLNQEQKIKLPSLPKVLVFRHELSHMSPRIAIFIRKEEVHDTNGIKIKKESLPYCFGILWIGDEGVAFIIPFADQKADPAQDYPDFTDEVDFSRYVQELLSLKEIIRASAHWFIDLSSPDETPLQWDSFSMP